MFLAVKWAMPMASFCLAAVGHALPGLQESEKDPKAVPKPAPIQVEEKGWSDSLHHFDNGFDLLIEPVKGSKVMGIFFFVKSGWNLDPLDRTGLAHFVEHMVMTAGTPGREGGWQYADWVRNRRHGANAMTRPGWTLYFSIGTREECSSDARWFKEVLEGKAKLKASQLERERERMQGEVKNMTLYRPGGILQWRARSLMLAGAAGRTGIGLPDDVDKIDLAEIQTRYAATHHAGNVLCIAVGRVHGEKDLPFYRDLFAGLKPRNTPAMPKWKASGKVEAVTEHPNVGATFASLAFRAPKQDDREFPSYLLAATWLMQRAMVERKPRGKQIQGMFFPAQYSYLEAPELFLLNLRGEDGQSESLVRKDLEAWLAKKRTSRVGWAYLRSGQTTLRYFYPPHPLEKQDLVFYARDPRNLYRLGLSRGVSVLSGLPRNLPKVLSVQTTESMQAALQKWFAANSGLFLALLPKKRN